MISSKKQIQQLANILLAKEVTNIVISPGSRNGAIIHTLASNNQFNIINLVDERSAAYFAMGMAISKKQPIAILCSSGTATLNYAPAIAEAYYQNIPLIILTADRPEYLINQLEAQCINQKNIYSNFVTQEITLPIGESNIDIAKASRDINNCINSAINNSKPIHINIPIEEPIYELENKEINKLSVRNIRTAKLNTSIDIEKLEILLNKLNQTKKILIIAGQMSPYEGLQPLIDLFADSVGAVVIHEILSNLKLQSGLSNFDLILSSLNAEELVDYQPEIVISIGGQLVSKQIKQFLRKYPPYEHWHICQNETHADTYMCLSEIIPVNPLNFFESMLAAFYDVKMGFKLNSKYRDIWSAKSHKINTTYLNWIENQEFSDFKVHNIIAQNTPENSILHLGNSTSIRYAILNGYKFISEFYCNRGTSGIDGSLSTAVGFASTSATINTIILGDLSFFYDSNALFNNDLPTNLRIIVINNQGGNIFGLIPGPNKTKAFEKSFLAKHNYSAKGIAETFGVEYISASDSNELSNALKKLYKNRNISLLEVFTNTEINTQIFNNIFTEIKTI